MAKILAKRVGIQIFELFIISGDLVRFGLTEYDRIFPCLSTNIINSLSQPKQLTQIRNDINGHPTSSSSL